jgi:nitroreductase
MDITAAIYSRRAVRAYTSRPPAPGMLQRLIDAAIQAPSAVNEQNWSFTVVQDKALLRKVSTQAKAYLLAQDSLAPHLRALVEDREFDIFYDAPALIVISSVGEGPWAVENCALAAENLMLAAYDEGLGSCWIGFAQPWLGTPDGREALQLQPGRVPRAPIIVGYPQHQPAAVPRREPEIRWIGP